MDRVERLLLDTVQDSFPVISRPYLVLAGLAGINEAEALERIQRLRREGIIRRIGGVFDSYRLGYFSTLCAAKIPGGKVPLLADLLNQIHGVTHNYLRTHVYNMWFTLIASSQTKAEAILASLREQSGISEIYSLPAIRLFKIKVSFDFSAGHDRTEEELTGDVLGQEDPAQSKTGLKYTEPGLAPPRKLTSGEIELAKLLQDDLPAGLTPYAELAERLAWTECDVFERIASLKRDGVIRRFGAVLRHWQAGFAANAMGVWQAPDDRTAEIGLVMSGFKEISHCYQRPALPGWSYNLFSMIHGRSQEECVRVMKEVAAATGVERYDMLFSTKELKKSSMKYFVD